VIPHNKPTLDSSEELAASEVIRSGWLAQGTHVEAFENEFCDFLGLPQGHAVAVSSGTSALYFALSALGAKKKTVSFPAYVCAALRNAVGMNQSIEELIDNEANSANVSIDQLNQSASDFAIVPHTYGIPVEIEKISNKVIIEDCCQAIGAKLGGKPVGTIATVGIYSFYATKLMTSGGQGGMIVSKDKAVIDELFDIREFDQRNDSKLRFNFQMTDIQAAIGRVQLKKLPGFLQRRQEIFNAYKQAGFNLFDVNDNNRAPVRYRAILRTNRAQQISAALLEKKIKTIIPLEDWELLGDRQDFLNAYEFTQTSLSLPIYPSLTDVDVNYIIDCVQNCL